MNPDGFKSLLALIGTNGQGVGTSSLADWVRNVELLELSDTEREDVNTLIDEMYDKLDEGSFFFFTN